jgi:hypothetical protein
MFTPDQLAKFKVFSQSLKGTCADPLRRKPPGAYDRKPKLKQGQARDGADPDMRAFGRGEGFRNESPADFTNARHRRCVRFAARHHTASRARIIAGLCGFFTLIGSLDGPDR